MRPQSLKPVTLADLKEYALKHPDRVFDTNSANNCLIASFLKEEKGFDAAIYSKSGVYEVVDKSGVTRRWSIVSTPISYDSRLLAVRPQHINHETTEDNYTGQELVNIIDSLTQSALA